MHEALGFKGSVGHASNITATKPPRSIIQSSKDCWWSLWGTVPVVDLVIVINTIKKSLAHNKATDCYFKLHACCTERFQRNFYPACKQLQGYVLQYLQRLLFLCPIITMPFIHLLKIEWADSCDGKPCTSLQTFACEGLELQDHTALHTIRPLRPEQNWFIFPDYPFNRWCSFSHWEPERSVVVWL